MTTTTELPSWRCHKVVQADKIASVVHDAGVGNPIPFDSSCRMFRLDCGADIVIGDDLHDRMARMPMSPVGGYYVRYEDGYESWSPAKAFEDGYTRC